MDEEESRALAAQEAAMSSRKRKAAQQPGAYEGMDFDDAEVDSSKPGSPKDKKKGNAANKRPNAQKSLELKELACGLPKTSDIRLEELRQLSALPLE